MEASRLRGLPRPSATSSQSIAPAMGACTMGSSIPKSSINLRLGHIATNYPQSVWSLFTSASVDSARHGNVTVGCHEGGVEHGNGTPDLRLPQHWTRGRHWR